MRDISSIIKKLSTLFFFINISTGKTPSLTARCFSIIKKQTDKETKIPLPVLFIGLIQCTDNSATGLAFVKHTIQDTQCLPKLLIAHCSLLIILSSYRAVHTPCKLCNPRLQDPLCRMRSMRRDGISSRPEHCEGQRGYEASSTL